ncbi:MAG: hypothetical protein ABJO01_11245 [Parasphingorhabdus sp.]|uniref:hypothetical protein n=1 Tax=Parasphingorhabdus sp. TaxID=2709688 RepID=UPI003297CB12
MIEITDAKIIKYQFEVPINRSPADIWDVMINKIDAWWMDDFRALGNGSIVTLNAERGGQLIESNADGADLEWYRIQMVSPGQALYLVGYMAPDWGGPTTSMLKLAVEERSDGGALVVSDALLGNVTEASANSAESGWKILFGDGLKNFAER